ncbi:DNA-directed RNA polymerase subunit omega [bacterium]|nr:DNA-directed RNA polymerase subunit omega [bacterium]
MEDHEFIDSKFRLVILASKRAKQLLHGAKKKIEMNAENPLTVALEEINQGKIDFEIILSKDGEGIETEDEVVNEQDKIKEETLSKAKTKKKLNSNDTGTEDDGDVEVAAQIQENQPD